MSKMTLVVKDDNILGFLHIYPDGNIHTEEDIENMFEQLMDMTPKYRDRKPWDKPDLIGAVKGHVSWYKPYDEKVVPPKTYNVLSRKSEGQI
tara:strand:+ start:758 stop:1033 length:276 start_codon:yes stop_codon:yes gene_type:complete